MTLKELYEKVYAKDCELVNLPIYIRAEESESTLDSMMIKEEQVDIYVAEGKLPKRIVLYPY